MLKLFIVYLGGNAKKANIEIHDVQFVIGKSIEDTYTTLRNNWFGSPIGLHIDSFKELIGIDGHEIEIKDYPQNIEQSLYFVNIGGYRNNSLQEFHEFGLFVAQNAKGAKNKALKTLLLDSNLTHKDELVKLDNCLQMDKIDKYFIHLKRTNQDYDLTPDWFGYNLIEEKG